MNIYKLMEKLPVERAKRLQKIYKPLIFYCWTYPKIWPLQSTTTTILEFTKNQLNGVKFYNSQFKWACCCDLWSLLKKGNVLSLHSIKWKCYSAK